MSNNAFMDFLNCVSETADALNKMVSPPDPEKKKPVMLTAEKLKEIRWMSIRQIETIYKNGKVPVTIEDTPEAYRELRWMTTGQLEALFGKQEEENDVQH